MGRATRGFTLVELMAVLAVLATVLALAVPGIRALRERQAALEAFHALSVSLAAARMAAVQRGRPVTVCPSQDGRSCRADGVWDGGWLVYADARREPQPASEADLIWVERRAASVVTIRSSPGRPRVRYQPTGLSGGNNASLDLCTRGGQHLGRVVVSRAGRARREWLGTEPPAPCPHAP